LLQAAARLTRQENWKVRLSFLSAQLQEKIPDPFVSLQFSHGVTPVPLSVELTGGRGFLQQSG
jgi:hypothetical protein